MQSFEDSERIIKLIVDSLAILCKNSVKYNEDLRVQGTIGITVDRTNVVLVSISELFEAHDGGNAKNHTPRGDDSVSHARSASTLSRQVVPQRRMLALQAPPSKGAFSSSSTLSPGSSGREMLSPQHAAMNRPSAMSAGTFGRHSYPGSKSSTPATGRPLSGTTPALPWHTSMSATSSLPRDQQSSGSSISHGGMVVYRRGAARGISMRGRLVRNRGGRVEMAGRMMSMQQRNPLGVRGGGGVGTRRVSGSRGMMGRGSLGRGGARGRGMLIANYLGSGGRGRPLSSRGRRARGGVAGPAGSPMNLSQQRMSLDSQQMMLVPFRGGSASNSSPMSARNSLNPNGSSAGTGADVVERIRAAALQKLAHSNSSSQIHQSPEMKSISSPAVKQQLAAMMQRSLPSALSVENAASLKQNSTQSSSALSVAFVPFTPPQKLIPGQQVIQRQQPQNQLQQMHQPYLQTVAVQQQQSPQTQQRMQQPPPLIQQRSPMMQQSFPRIQQSPRPQQQQLLPLQWQQPQLQSPTPPLQSSHRMPHQQSLATPQQSAHRMPHQQSPVTPQLLANRMPCQQSPATPQQLANRMPCQQSPATPQQALALRMPHQQSPATPQQSAHRMQQQSYPQVQQVPGMRQQGHKSSHVQNQQQLQVAQYRQPVVGQQLFDPYKAKQPMNLSTSQPQKQAGQLVPQTSQQHQQGQNAAQYENLKLDQKKKHMLQLIQKQQLSSAAAQILLQGHTRQLSGVGTEQQQRQQNALQRHDLQHESSAMMQQHVRDPQGGLKQQSQRLELQEKQLQQQHGMQALSEKEKSQLYHSNQTAASQLMAVRFSVAAQQSEGQAAPQSQAQVAQQLLPSSLQPSTTQQIIAAQQSILKDMELANVGKSQNMQQSVASVKNMLPAQQGQQQHLRTGLPAHMSSLQQMAMYSTAGPQQMSMQSPTNARENPLLAMYTQQSPGQSGATRPLTHIPLSPLYLASSASGIPGTPETPAQQMYAANGQNSRVSYTAPFGSQQPPLPQSPLTFNSPRGHAVSQPGGSLMGPSTPSSLQHLQQGYAVPQTSQNSFYFSPNAGFSQPNLDTLHQSPAAVWSMQQAAADQQKRAAGLQTNSPVTVLQAALQRQLQAQPAPGQKQMQLMQQAAGLMPAAGQKLTQASPAAGLVQATQASVYNQVRAGQANSNSTALLRSCGFAKKSSVSDSVIVLDDDDEVLVASQSVCNKAGGDGIQQGVKAAALHASVGSALSSAPATLPLAIGARQSTSTKPGCPIQGLAGEQLVDKAKSAEGSRFVCDDGGKAEDARRSLEIGGARRNIALRFGDTGGATAGKEANNNVRASSSGALSSDGSMHCLLDIADEVEVGFSDGGEVVGGLNELDGGSPGSPDTMDYNVEGNRCTDSDGENSEWRAVCGSGGKIVAGKEASGTSHSATSLVSVRDNSTPAGNAAHDSQSSTGSNSGSSRRAIGVTGSNASQSSTNLKSVASSQSTSWHSIDSHNFAGGLAGTPNAKRYCMVPMCCREFANDEQLANHYSEAHRVSYAIDPLYASDYAHLLADKVAAMSDLMISCPFKGCTKQYDTLVKLFAHHTREHFKLKRNQKDKLRRQFEK